MTIETAQPHMAAENDGLNVAANAFKAFVAGDVVPDAPVNRDEQGRFAAMDEEIETEDAPEYEADAEAVEDSVEGENDGEAASDEEAQQEPPLELPTSWAADKADVWENLPRDAQEYLISRDREVNAAVNQKFQEAANVRKANEAIVQEAAANRTRYLEAVDSVLSLVQPTKPSYAMLDPNSESYNPDGYHLMTAQYEQQAQYVNQLQQQRHELVAQQQAEMEQMALQAYHEIENRARPAFLTDVPDVTDPVKGNAVLNEIAEYAVSLGIPPDIFTDPSNAQRITSAEYHMAWKAMQYDKIKAAESRVKPTAKPKPSQPALKPGPTASRSSVEKARTHKAFQRLAQEGSVEAGAAIFKSMMSKR